MELFKGTLHNRCALPGFVETADHPLFARRLWEEVGGGSSSLLGGGGGELGGLLGGGEMLASLGGNLSELLVGNSSSSSSSLGGGSLSSSLGSSLGASFASLGGSLVLTGRALKGELDHHKGPLALPDGTLLPYGMTIQDKYDTEVSCSPSKGPNVCIVNEAPKNSTCHYFDRDPNAGMTSFDSIGLAFIILLQTVTFDSWASPMYQMMFAFSPYVWIYFLTICMLGGFFVVNLFLAVIFQQFRDFGAAHVLVTRLGHFQRFWQIGPQLKAVHLALRISFGHFLVQNAAACRHPLHIAALQRAAIAKAVAMIDSACQNVGDRFYPAMGMPRKARAIIGRVIAAKIVEHQKRVKPRGIAKAKGAVQMHARAFHMRLGQRSGFDGAKGHGSTLGYDCVAVQINPAMRADKAALAHNAVRQCTEGYSSHGMVRPVATKHMRGTKRGRTVVRVSIVRVCRADSEVSVGAVPRNC
jgi:hypothetical protein